MFVGDCLSRRHWGRKLSSLVRRACCCMCACVQVSGLRAGQKLSFLLPLACTTARMHAHVDSPPAATRRAVWRSPRPPTAGRLPQRGLFRRRRRADDQLPLVMRAALAFLGLVRVVRLSMASLTDFDNQMLTVLLLSWSSSMLPMTVCLSCQLYSALA
jgi:hypothetical protein